MASSISERYDKAMQVQLSERQEYHGFVLYNARSSSGNKEYTVWLRDGVAVGCSCPASPECQCRHKLAAQMAEGFLVAWNAPVEQASGSQDDIIEPESVEEMDHEAAMIASVVLGEDAVQHIEDEFGTCYTCPNPVKPGFTMCPQCSGAAAA